MRKLSAQEIAIRLPKHLKLDESTYINTKTKSRFIDIDFGDFWATYDNVRDGTRLHGGRAKFSKSKKMQKSLEDVVLELPKYLILDLPTYVNYNTKCKFADEVYGDFWAMPKKVLLRGRNHPERTRENYIRNILPTRKDITIKSRSTMKNKYGFAHALSNPVFAKKAAKAQGKNYISYHWMDKSELICQSKWELKVVEFLNSRKVPYLWQHKTFTLEEINTTYRPDLFLVDENKWIEIKGWFREPAKAKWDIFTKMFPNSELWDKPVLKAMGIL